MLLIAFREVVSVEKLHTTVKEDMTKQFSVQLPFVELEQVMDAITKDQDWYGCQPMLALEC